MTIYLARQLQDLDGSPLAVSVERIILDNKGSQVLHPVVRVGAGQTIEQESCESFTHEEETLPRWPRVVQGARLKPVYSWLLEDRYRELHHVSRKIETMLIVTQ